MTESEAFAGGRNNPIENVDSAELNNLLGSVAIAFGEHWLAQPSGTNRIQALWSRQDGLATNQLAILGDAIERLEPLNADWVIKRIRAIKSESANNRTGDLFELLGLSLFALDGQSVTAGREHNPDYDGTIDFGNGALASVSLKDFGVSYMQRALETQAASIEDTMVAALRDHRLNGVGLRVEASRYPLEADWSRLSRAVRGIISDCSRNFRPRQNVGIWTLTLQQLGVGHVQLADSHLSYTLTALAPHYNNEQQNIQSKIEDACSNLSKHAGTPAASTARFLLIRIPGSASSTECVACTQQWLRERPDAGVDVVILYQPVVAARSIGAPSGIVHVIAIVAGPGLERWRRRIDRPSLAIQARVLVGICTNQPTKLFGANGLAVGDQYIYQRGQIYALPRAKLDGTIVGDLINPAPGVMIHSVLRIPGQPGALAVSGKFPPDDKLMLYSWRTRGARSHDYARPPEWATRILCGERPRQRPG